MKDQRTATLASQRISFSLQGLGEQKVVVNKYGNSTHVHDKITDSGGYEILRISDDKSKNLREIPMSANGYSVSYLKSTLGQAKAYIKSTQRNLSLEAIKVSTSVFSVSDLEILWRGRGCGEKENLFFALLREWGVGGRREARLKTDLLLPEREIRDEFFLPLYGNVVGGKTPYTNPTLC